MVWGLTYIFINLKIYARWHENVEVQTRLLQLLAIFEPWDDYSPPQMLFNSSKIDCKVTVVAEEALS